MAFSGKLALTMFVSAAAVLVSSLGAGTASAERGPNGSLYGSLALSTDGGLFYGAAWNYPNWGSSDADAIGQCAHRGCTVVAQFRDGCGAIAESADHNYYYGGSGSNRAEAEQDAMTRLTNYLPQPTGFFGSSAPAKQSVHIRYTQCTDGA
ncbi:DUF4189 domain-containing protein [Nocardia sp. ET3-3]|uniref:DUF4189 domain-containing protein n=1 Tax=Nocardia terrae TaxID=2675851 RepID=A0A7K1UZK8_9NOCA|nr:DUF4189 domain-containing protein [Nocardia terrae]MVU79742.1 DUF4189 domain-containing protein [Nocardia terrae]